MRLRPGRAIEPREGVPATAPLRRTRPPARPPRPPAAPGAAAVLVRRRSLGVLGKIVGNLEPRRLAADKNVPLRSHSWIIVENAEWNPEVGAANGGPSVIRRRPVDDRRSAPAAESAAETGGRLVVAHELFAFQ